MSQQVQKGNQERNISDAVLAKVQVFQEAGALVLPKDYSPANALKAAFLVLQELRNKDGKLLLEVCTPTSVANSLLKMVVWGLSPLKKQCDFIAYGNQMTCQPEYTGNIALAKRYGGLKDIHANPVFKGDKVVITVNPKTGRKELVSHGLDMDNWGVEVTGAYAVMTFNDGTTDVEYMSMAQIVKSWEQGQAGGKSKAHINFSDQMAIKTVYNRATKPLIRTSDDSALFVDEDDESRDVVRTAIEKTIADNANKQDLGFTPVEVVEEGTKALPEKQANPIDGLKTRKTKQPEPVKETVPSEPEKQAEMAVANEPEPQETDESATDWMNED